MKQIILSADDFGRSPERNKAIDECFKKGFIKSAGIIVTGQHLQEAVNLMNRGGYVEHVHCHFNLSGNIQGDNSLDKPLTKKMANDKLFSTNGYFKTYRGRPTSPKYVFKCLKVYRELCAQYNRFLLVTDGHGDNHHIDFHIWYNLTWPVSVALNLFTWTHKINSVRYTGIHFYSRKMKLFRLISWNPFVKYYLSSNIDYFLSKPDLFSREKKIELYCHPNYVNGLLLDDSVSYLGHEKQMLETNIQMLKKRGDLELVSWAE